MPLQQWVSPVDEIRNGKRSYEELEAVYKEMLARIRKSVNYENF